MTPIERFEKATRAIQFKKHEKRWISHEEFEVDAVADDLLALVDAVEDATSKTNYPHYMLPTLEQWQAIVDALAKLKGES